MGKLVPSGRLERLDPGIGRLVALIFPNLGLWHRRVCVLRLRGWIIKACRCRDVESSSGLLCPLFFSKLWACRWLVDLRPSWVVVESKNSSLTKMVRAGAVKVVRAESLRENTAQTEGITRWNAIQDMSDQVCGTGEWLERVEEDNLHKVMADMAF